MQKIFGSSVAVTREENKTVAVARYTLLGVHFARTR